MRPGDLVRIVSPYLQSFHGKVGLIAGFPDEQDWFDSEYRLWDVMVDGKMMRIQGMNLEVISETR
jgi:hypothetical protein